MPPPGFYLLKQKERAVGSSPTYLELDVANGPLTDAQLRGLDPNIPIALHTHMTRGDRLNMRVERAKKTPYLLPLDSKDRTGRLVRSVMIPQSDHTGHAGGYVPTGEIHIIYVLPPDVPRPTSTVGRKLGQRSGECPPVQTPLLDESRTKKRRRHK